MIVKFAAGGVLVLMLIGSGCIEPSSRIGSYPSQTIGTSFSDPGNLGRHNSYSEKTGQVYTCRAGHIDLAHMRKTIDWTSYLANKTYDHLMQNERDFTFKMKEPSLFFVTLNYPRNWRNMPRNQKERIAHEISIKLGAYFAFTSTNWHEILTWFGYRSTGIYSEFTSAFSWEDTISNLLGTYVAVEALADTDRSFNEAVTIILDRYMAELGAQPSSTARIASSEVRGKWYTEQLLVTDMTKRNLDIGLDDGTVTPWLISSVRPCRGTRPKFFKVPTQRFLADHGFSMKVEIEPREWEAKEILNIVYSGRGTGKTRINPEIHFARIMDYIGEDAVRRYGPDVENSTQY